MRRLYDSYEELDRHQRLLFLLLAVVILTASCMYCLGFASWVLRRQFPSSTPTPQPSATPLATKSASPTLVPLRTAPAMPTAMPTQTKSPTPRPSAVVTQTPVPSSTGTRTPSPSATLTEALVEPTVTPSLAPSNTWTLTPTEFPTATHTPLFLDTPVPTETVHTRTEEPPTATAEPTGQPPTPIAQPTQEQPTATLQPEESPTQASSDVVMPADTPSAVAAQRSSWAPEPDSTTKGRVPHRIHIRRGSQAIPLGPTRSSRGSALP